MGSSFCIVVSSSRLSLDLGPLNVLYISIHAGKWKQICNGLTKFLSTTSLVSHNDVGLALGYLCLVPKLWASVEFAKKTIRYNIAHVLNNTSNLITKFALIHSLNGFTVYTKKTSSQNMTLNVISQIAIHANTKKKGTNQVNVLIYLQLVTCIYYMY